tara:strand:- start:301 stop:531 length:231 start_codon:yes stop_codon:yes gene_type:complete
VKKSTAAKPKKKGMKKLKKKLAFKAEQKALNREHELKMQSRQHIQEIDRHAAQQRDQSVFDQQYYSSEYFKRKPVK